MKKTILASAAAISAAVVLAGCNQSSDNAAQAASQPQAVAPIVATGKLAATDSKNSGWWAAESGGTDCIDESGPGELIKDSASLGQQYKTQDTLDAAGNIMRTDLYLQDRGVTLTFFRQKDACLASTGADVARAGASADEARYGGEGATPAQAAQSAPTPNSEQDSPMSRYLEKVRQRVRPYIEWGGETQGLATVIEVHCSPNGSIQSATVKAPSGNAGWDDAALKAVQRADPMPADTNGKTPASFAITLRPAG
jgi:TonB family protein